MLCSTVVVLGSGLGLFAFFSCCWVGMDAFSFLCSSGRMFDVFGLAGDLDFSPVSCRPVVSHDVWI